MTGTNDPVLADRGTRLLAAIVDGLILAALAWALTNVPVVNALLTPKDESFFALNVGALLVGYPLFLVVQGWCLVQRSQTLGKMLCGIRIVRTDGSPASAARLLGLRYGVGYLTSISFVLSSLYGIIDSLLIFRSSRQCLHDTIADTKVIKA
ncbi:RDD family protein [Roseateles depolymerans]|uniref:RDD family protein n=1 Tax=Roseateles depolymerans TaxID=76731 RepID=UPI001B863640|nr:RDD family protein [Roseateles depolymerans]